MVPENKRDIHIDLARVVAIFSVLLVHTHQGSLIPSEAGIATPILFFLGKLGVPLFVLISGALLLPKKESSSLFYQKRVPRIVVPWLVWTGIYIIFTVVTNNNNYLPIDLFKISVRIFLSDFWFMPMILGIYLLSPYVSEITKSAQSWKTFFIGWFLLVSIFPLLYLSPLFPGSSSAGLLTLVVSFSGYYLAGWYLIRYFSQKFSAVHLIATLFGAAICYTFLAQTTQMNDRLHFFVLHDYFSFPIVVGSLALLLAYKQIPHTFFTQRVQDVLQTLSGYTFGIFLSHQLILTVLTQYLPAIFSDISIYWWIFRTVLLYSLSATVIHLLYQIPVLKKFVT